MINTSVILVEEGDGIKDGQIIVQAVPEKDQITVADAFGNHHPITKYVLMTEVTLRNLIDALSDMDLRRHIEKGSFGILSSAEVIRC